MNDPTRNIEIYDTTLRDGTQGEGVSFSLQDKLLITERLAEIGVDFVEGGFPLSNEKDAEFFQRARRLNLGSTQVCAFGMTRRRGVAAEDDPGMRALLACEAPVITLVGKTWDLHALEVLRVTLEENLDMIRESIECMRRRDRRVVYDAEHFFDGWKANPEYALRTLAAAAEAGAEIAVLCDTNGGSLPEEIAAGTRGALEALAPWGVGVGIHTHNDGELAVANTLAGVDAGASQVQGTINGFGERCGNADLISVIANLALKKGYRVIGGTGLEHLTELSRFVYETANLRLRDNQPFVGRSAFAHKGGMHVHAVAKLASSYEHIDPQVVGNERRVLVSELSGRSNIVALTTRHNLQHDRALQDRILAEVVRLENLGYQFEAATASFDLLVKRCAGAFAPHFEVLQYQVKAGDYGGGRAFADATVKLRLPEGDIRFEAAEGDGPVDALNSAMRKALNGRFPALSHMRLVDYKVRVVNTEAGTAARILVFIESADEHEVWGTVGVSENIIEASWEALRDSFEYKLYKDGAAAGQPAAEPQAASV